MLGAGLLAKKAVEKGLTVAAVREDQPRARLAGGDRVPPAAGLLPYLEALGFHVVGYGCTTCIGNSGPLPDAVSKAVNEEQRSWRRPCSAATATSRAACNPHVKANYLASPPLVVAYALAGTVDIDLNSEPLGTGTDGKPVCLKDIWPTTEGGRRGRRASAITPEMFEQVYANVFDGNADWNAIPVAASELYAFDAKSHVHPGAAVLPGPQREPAPLKPTSRARASWPCSATRSPPITSRPAGDIAPRAPPAASSRRKASRRRTSTPTARGAATTA